MEAVKQQLRKGPIVASLLIAAFVAILSQTLLNVALPKMMESLNVSSTTIQWLITGYMLVNGILVPISAYLIDKFSTRHLFIAATGLFTVGTLICAVAPGFEVLLAGRLIQAAGAGILMPLMSIVFLTIFPIEQRGKAMGMMGLAMIFAPAVGPTLSGWVVEHHSWRVLFYIVLPLTVFGLIYGSFAMKNVTKLSSPKLDLPGIIFSTLGFGGLLYGFSDAANPTEGWNSARVILSLSAGVLFLLLFLWRELKVEKPILELRVFKYDMFSLTTVINMIITMAMFSGMILLPIFLQTILGFTPLKSGLLLLPGALLMGVMSPVAGMLFDKIGARWLAVFGLAITTYTTYELSHLTVDTSYNHMLLLYTVRMFGMSFLMMPIQTAGMNQLPQRLNAHGSAMSQTLRNVAGALGTAFLVTMFSSSATANGTDQIAAAHIPQAEVVAFDKLLASGQLHADDKAKFVETLAAANIDPQHAMQMIEFKREATVYGINFAFEIATWMTVAALLLAFFVRRTKPHTENVTVKEGTAVQA
ncbi:DHA2 family efflux MFS transporter permease subunit [Cohnella pontilimi]|uniref:DHA2 family efflux MFS transporter permease subunit n=1 Tax=Cohnella pontilimi TaxID=2564100 RepID=A0A4U0FEG5_9BACL|nr:DHA2 family efflux MFS transporter permease subunit [Cohnella pontilimi]TJY43217.1 DHA2 family efflux MFS transporter permease subunit [Cohnella pontilimi]